MKFFALIFFLAFKALAQMPAPTDENWRIALGLAYANQISKRGIVTYSGDQILPVFSMNLGSPRLFLSGTTLNYKMTPLEALILRARLSANATPDTPLYISQESLDERVRRNKSTEAELFWEWKVKSFFEITGHLSQDLFEHGGAFGRLGFRWILGTYYQGLLEPGITYSQGYGNLPHNEYLYGVGAKSGLALKSVGFSVAAPSKVDSFYPILEITKSWLEHEQLQSAAYVRPNEFDTFQLLVWGAVRVW